MNKGALGFSRSDYGRTSIAFDLGGTRKRANGTLDNTFGFLHSGRQFFLKSNYTSEEINAIGIASNGKIVGVGSGIRAGMTSSSTVLVRMTAWAPLGALRRRAVCESRCLAG